MVIRIGVERAKVLGRYMRGIRRAEEALEIERSKLAIAAEAMFAGTDVRGQITQINEVDGTVTTQEDDDG